MLNLQKILLLFNDQIIVSLICLDYIALDLNSRIEKSGFIFHKKLHTIYSTNSF